MPKFFFAQENKRSNNIEIHGSTAHHIVNVLRYKIGDEVLLCDGNCVDYVTKLVSYETRKCSTIARFEALEVKKSMTEPPIFIRLFQSVIKWENFDFAVQKSVEVGVGEIVPIITNRSIYKLSDTKKKIERLNRIAKSAAEQSERGVLPKIAEPISLDAHLKSKDAVSLFACCEEKISITQRLDNLNPEEVEIWIGPEGGFTDSEREMLMLKEIIPFSLGPRVLRSETAGIVSIANLLMLYRR